MTTSDSIDRVFSHALATVRRLPRTGSSRPPPAARLRLYGLYKQSMEGDVDAILPRPALPPPALTRYGSRQLRTREAQAEIEKWDAWHACKGMSRTAAKKAYIRTLIETMKEYASGTQESRELVGELEFVWRQVTDSSKWARARAYLKAGGKAREARQAAIPAADNEDESEADGSVVRNEEVSDASDSASDAESSPASAGDDPWRLSVEAHLRHLSTEIAALREQLASHYLLAPSGYSPYVYQHLSFRWRLWYRLVAWVRWAVWLAVRQALVQLSLLGLALLYGRWKGDRRLETWLRERVRVALSWARRGRDWRWLSRLPFG
ncbi:hypothetical protein DV738_g4494, partial [Chaetothyriales sp. CBS 135597]